MTNSIPPEMPLGLGTAHMNWRTHFPEDLKRLADEAPQHLEKMEEGYSWIEYVGGPQDGNYTYFVGSPPWDTFFLDPIDDPLHPPPIGPRHHYCLSKGPSGNAIYAYQGSVIVNRQEGE